MRKWFEGHSDILAILLLLLAVVNGWLAVFAKDPISALANGAMAVLLVLGVTFFWRAGRPY